MAEAKSIPRPFKVTEVFPRVWRMMTKREKQKSGILFLGTIINSFVEILGLAAVLPVIGLVLKPELIQSNTYLARAFEFTSLVGIDSEKKFLILTAVLLIAAFVFKALFSLGLNLFQTRFSLGIGHRLSGLMWQYHFAQSLERMRSTQSGRVLAEINGWPGNLADKFIVGGMRLINELLVIVLIIVGLLAYEPIVLVCVGILITFGAWAIKAFTKQKLNHYSDIRQIVGPETGTIINNAVRGFLEVITFRASESIRKNYLRKRDILIRIASNSQILMMMPAKLYEVLAIVGVSLAIIFSLLLGDSNEDFFNLLIVMALSAYRIMPSMTRINGKIMAMRQNKFVLDTIELALTELAHLQSIPPKAGIAMPRVNIQIQDITVGYKTLQEPVLDGLSVAFPSASINAIVGPSGSGKSTLVNTLLGLHNASKGSIALEHNGTIHQLGVDLEVSNWLEHIGYLSQQPYLFNGSVRDNLTMLIPGFELNEDEVEKLIHHLELTDCLGEDPLEFELQEGGNNLSGGQQQRLAIIRALRVDRPVLILDEATSALDHVKRDVVFELLRKRAKNGTNILLITHDRELARQCDTILDLSNMP